ncbi:hypothetical protein PO909_008845 [Leuciscus waleckii]
MQQSRCFHHPPASLSRDTHDLQMKVDFFRKLGYSPEEVKAALRKLGLGTDTNAVLGELVRSGAKAVPSSSSDSDDGLPQWGGSSSKGPGSTLEDNNEPESDLKPIVIDGSNVAMSHGNKEVFSCRGIEKEQPRPDVPISDQYILEELERKKFLVFTPSRRIGGKRVVCYDDRFIIKLAHDLDGIIVSNDTYRDLQSERPEWKRCIEERLLMYSFVNDKFMPPDDPLGRHGPNLDNFLRKKTLLLDHKRQLCPYGKKCTYGIKCKFYHPERTNQSQRSLADELRENARLSGSKEDSRYWDDILSMKNPLNRAPVGQRSPLVDRTSLQAPFPTNPSSIFSSDSGFSEPSQSIDDLHRMRSGHPPLSGIPTTPAGSQRYYDNMSPYSNFHPNYSAYSSLPLPNPVQSYSLPAYGGWSYPLYLPQTNSLPEPLPCPSSHRSPDGYGSQQHSAMPQSSAFQEEREEVRKRLYAIFNPHHVNKVMEMFPQLKDAQQLAAEILKLKSRGDFF